MFNTVKLSFFSFLFFFLLFTAWWIFFCLYALSLRLSWRLFMEMSAPSHFKIMLLFWRPLCWQNSHLNINRLKKLRSELSLFVIIIPPCSPILHMMKKDRLSLNRWFSDFHARCLVWLMPTCLPTAPSAVVLYPPRWVQSMLMSWYAK